MKDIYHIGCFWSGRLESDEQFAQRSAAWFRELSRVDPLLARWCLTERTVAEAVETSPTVEVLREIFTRKPYKSDLGLSFHAWNRRDEPDHCSTHMTSGWSPGLFPALC